MTECTLVGPGSGWFAQENQKRHAPPSWCAPCVIRRKYGNDETKTREFVRHIYESVPVLDSGARRAGRQVREPFPHARAVPVDDAYGGWRKAHPRFFGDHGVFDPIYEPGK